MFKRGLHHFFFFGISFLLVFIWFRDGNTLGAGETGNPFYNLRQMFAISGYAWGNQVLGGNSGLTVTSGLFWGVLYGLNGIGIPGVLLQAGFFFICLNMGMFATYLLVKEVFPGIKRWSALLAALFYIFNPFSLMNIWNRFLTNTILFYAFMPLSIWLIVNGLKSKKYSNAILLSLVTAILSFAFAAPAQTIIFWGLFFFTVVFYFFIIEKTFFALKFFLLGAVSWVLFNFWWISQQISFRFSETYTVSTASFFTDAGNFRALTSLSDSLGQIGNVFLLLHGPFFTDATDMPYSWPLIYTRVPALILQWAVFLLVLFIAIRNIKNKWVFYFLSLFLLGILASKGIALPMGELFNYMFQYLSILNFFRNPFEKLGILLPFAFAPLFAYSFMKLTGKIFRAFLILFIFVFYGWPFWTGLVFSSGNPPANNPEINYEIIVPEYYREANAWLNDQEGEFRFISFPLGGEGIFHTWEKGYAGIEQSGLLFDRPNISYNTTIPYYSDAIEGLEETLMKNDDFAKVASLFNVRYILVRDDVDYKKSGLRNPETVKKRLETLAQAKDTNISFAKRFGNLYIYEIDESQFVPRIYASENIIAKSGLANVKDVFFTDFSPGDVILDDSLIDRFGQPKSFLVTPQSVYHDHLLKPQISTDSNIFPHISSLPASSRYLPVKLKEMLLTAMILDPERKAEYLSTLLGKRIKEMEQAVAINDLKSIRLASQAYRNAYPEAVKLYQTLPREKLVQEKLWRQGFVTAMFLSHASVLEEMEGKAQGEGRRIISDLKSEIKAEMRKMLLVPAGQAVEIEGFPVENRVVYQFDVPRAGRYEFFIDEKNLGMYYEIPESMPVQVNGEVENRVLSPGADGYYSFGVFELSEGINELGFNIPKAKNLLDVPDKMKARSDVHDGEYVFSVNDFDPYSVYNLSFNYLISRGAGFEVSFAQNTDHVRKGKIRREFSKALAPDSYQYDIRSFGYDFKANSSADSAEVIYSIKPWNDCRSVLYYAAYKCNDEAVSLIFERPTEVVLENISLTKRMRQGYLRLVGDPQIHVRPDVNFRKISQTEYDVEVKGATEPFILVFSELFDMGWSLSDESGNNYTHVVANGYANAWYVDSVGDKKLKLYYSPQRNLENGTKFSALIITGGLVALALLRRKESENEE